MSRIARVPLQIPKEVKVAVEGSVIKVEGPKGKLELNIPLGIKLEQKDNAITFKRLNDTKQSRANHGTMRALIANMVEGVTKGHKKELEIQGVGFRVQPKGKDLVFNLGLSHQVDFKVPAGVKISAPSQTSVIVEGPDKSFVGYVAAQIRGLKRPEPYKGKGIRYSGETVRRKQGKSVAK